MLPHIQLFHTRFLDIVSINRVSNQILVTFTTFSNILTRLWSDKLDSYKILINH